MRSGGLYKERCIAPAFLAAIPFRQNQILLAIQSGKNGKFVGMGLKIITLSADS